MFVPDFRQACERSTVRLFPGFSRRHPKRHDAQSSVGVIVLPAVSASGRLHFHGWIRIPHQASQTPQRLTVSEDGRPLAIVAPEALVVVARALVSDKDAPFGPWWGHSTSLWIANRDGHASSTRISGCGFSYLRKKADHELRMWSKVEYIPELVFTRVEEVSRTRRNDRVHQLREQRRQRRVASGRRRRLSWRSCSSAAGRVPLA